MGSAYVHHEEAAATQGGPLRVGATNTPQSSGELLPWTLLASLAFYAETQRSAELSETTWIAMPLAAESHTGTHCCVKLI